MCGHAGRLRTKSSMNWRGEKEAAKEVEGPASAAGLGGGGSISSPSAGREGQLPECAPHPLVSSPKPSVCSLILFNK